MKDRTIRFVYPGFLAVCAVIGFAAFAAFRNISQTEATSDWVNHTHATVYALDRVLASFVAGDGAARTYILTGGERELSESRGEFSEMTDHLETLKALTRDNAGVHAQVLELETIAERHAEAARTLMDAREGRDRAALAQLSQAGPGVEDLQEVKRRAARIRAGQFELLDERERAAYRQAQTTRWVLGTCLALDLLLLGGAAWLIRDDIATRLRLAETLQAANTTLEAKVAERTRELTEANARLTTENLERKWSAQAVEHQLRYNQVIVSATSDLVFVVTKTQAITRVNPAVALRTGWPEEEILGRPLRERLEGGEAIDAALRSGRELHQQAARLVQRDGTRLAGTFTLLPIRDNDKVVGGVVLVRLA